MTDSLVERFIPGPRYLGDGVYIKSSGWSTAVDLTTSDGITTTNLIALEPEIWRALIAYMDDLKAGVEQLAKEREKTATDD